MSPTSHNEGCMGSFQKQNHARMGRVISFLKPFPLRIQTILCGILKGWELSKVSFVWRWLNHVVFPKVTWWSSFVKVHPFLHNNWSIGVDGDWELERNHFPMLDQLETLHFHHVGKCDYHLKNTRLFHPPFIHILGWQESFLVIFVSMVWIFTFKTCLNLQNKWNALG